MACHHFVDGRLCHCLAVRGFMVPSLHEREHFCRDGQPGACPTYQIYAQRNGPLPLDMYYGLWTVPPADEVASVRRECG